MMFEWFVENFWALWLIIMLLLISVQVVTGEMTFLLIAAGALTAIIADVLGAPLYVQLIIVTVISIDSLYWLRISDTKRRENNTGASPWSVNRYVDRIGDVTEEVCSSEARMRISNEVWSVLTYGPIAIPPEATVVIQ